MGSCTVLPELRILYTIKTKLIWKIIIPPLTLAFDARGTTSQTINVPMEETTRSITIRSYRNKKVNGTVTGSELINFEVTNLNSWITTLKTTNDALSYEFRITVRANLGEARTGSITLTQASSGKKITINISQAAGVTVQQYVLTTSILGLFLPANGGSRTCEVESYALMSDGSKNPIFPTNIGQPSWITKVTIAQVSGERFNVTVKAGANNTGNSRNGNLTLKTPGDSVEGVELEIPLNQMAPVTEQDITLTLKLPTENFTGALFADGEAPINSGGPGGYFSFNSMFGQFSWTFKPSTGIIVNQSSPGSTQYAKPGDRVKVYQNPSSGTWSYIGTFTMPSTDATIIV